MKGRKGKNTCRNKQAITKADFLKSFSFIFAKRYFRKMSLKKRAQSFQYAFRGIAELFKSQPNARIHLVAAAMVVLAGFYFQISRTEWIAVTLCIFGVLSLEAVNTAIEHLTDLVSPGFHPLAGKAKDVAAAAVLLVAIGAVVVAGIIFSPRIFACFSD